MPRNPVEIIVFKQLAGSLAIPVFVVGPSGKLLYFNEPAEPLLGLRFDEAGELDIEEWSKLIPTFDESGKRFQVNKRPLVVSLNERRPIHGRLNIQRFDGRTVRVEGTAIPLVAADGRMLGAIAFFWEGERPEIPEPSPAPAPLDTFQHSVDMILARRFSCGLSSAVFLSDPDGQILYINPAAETILGVSFEKIDEIEPDELYKRFDPRDENERVIDSEDLPLPMARKQRKPIYRRMGITGLDGTRRTLDVTALPLVGHSGRLLGAIGIFWDVERR